MTLVEVLCATALVGLALAPVMTSFSYAQTLIADARQRAMACRLLESRVESLNSSDGELLGDSSETVTVNSVPYSFTTTVTLPVPGDTRLKRVAVTVRWTGPFGTSAAHDREFLVVGYRP